MQWPLILFSRQYSNPYINYFELAEFTVLPTYMTSISDGRPIESMLVSLGQIFT